MVNGTIKYEGNNMIVTSSVDHGEVKTTVYPIAVEGTGLYVVSIPANESAQHINYLRDSIEHFLKEKDIRVPVLLLPDNINISAVTEFDFSTALILLKRGKNVKLPNMIPPNTEEHLYMEHGTIYVRDISINPDEVWTPTQDELLTTKWTIVI